MNGGTEPLGIQFCVGGKKNNNVMLSMTWKYLPLIIIIIYYHHESKQQAIFIRITSDYYGPLWKQVYCINTFYTLFLYYSAISFNGEN